jgi:hypothetical protein
LDDRWLLAAITMSDADQLMLELVNRARANPAVEATRYGIDLNQGLPPGTISTAAKPPLAPNQALIDVAELHTQLMLDTDELTHYGPGTATVGDRAQQVGYEYLVIGENIGWTGTPGPAAALEDAVYALHQDLFLSPTHRQNMLRADFVEVGVGVRSGVFRQQGTDYNATLVTVDFGSRAGDYFLTGVAYADPAVTGNFFSLGEGLTEVTITAQNTASGTTYTTTTDTSGGYVLQVPAGVYNLRGEGGTLTTPIAHPNIALNTANVKVDFLVAGLPPPVALPDAGMCLPGAAVVVDVLANDTAVAALIPETVEIVTAPQHGSVTVDLPTGKATYTPVVGFVGLDRFTYRVSDAQGKPSEPAQVTVTTVDLGHFPWQNPALAEDVNGDGYVTPLDALQLINAINTGGVRTLTAPAPDTAFPPPYLDVTGDGDLTPLDVLRVINNINAGGQPEGEAGPGWAPQDEPTASTVLEQAAGPVAGATQRDDTCGSVPLDLIDMTDPAILAWPVSDLEGLLSDLAGPVAEASLATPRRP